VSDRALAAHRDVRSDEADDEAFGASGGLAQELFLVQIETGTQPTRDIAELVADVRRCRQSAAESARSAGAELVATATAVIGGEDREVTRKTRYERIVATFGEISRQGSVCGMHVHVEVRDAAEAVKVIDRLRPWLPVLRAMSVNSPFYYGVDTGYASWRTQIWSRWPTAGPCEPYGDLSGYRQATDALIASGAALDRGMLYLDARVSEHYPTIEIRVFDVVSEPTDVGLLAALTRALVDTLAERSDGPVWRSDLTKAAHWLASRDGLSRDLVEPFSAAPVSARQVIERMIDHCGESLRRAGDLDRVSEGLDLLLARGTGATQQRAAAERTGSMDGVVADLRERFTASLSEPRQAN
jgi:carboxylate-amine ligase